MRAAADNAQKEVELALKRGRLQERIAAQRATLAAQVVPDRWWLATADRAVALGRSGVAYIRTHPLQVGAAFALLAILRPRRVWRWSRRAFIAWVPGGNCAPASKRTASSVASSPAPHDRAAQTLPALRRFAEA